MKKPLKTLLLASVLCGGLLSGAATANTYDIDIVHSRIVFFIDHLGLARVIGTANDFTGSFTFDAAHPEASSLSAAVKVASIDTNSTQRDSDIQGADWFNATEFPDITFVGTAFAKTGDATGTITGDLTIAGVTNPATLEVTFNKEGDNPWSGLHFAGFSARTSIKRSDFGMQAAQGMIGDEVELFLEIEGQSR
jgi:polyisoprenoid-binding protein YceI